MCEYSHAIELDGQGNLQHRRVCVETRFTLSIVLHYGAAGSFASIMGVHGSAIEQVDCARRARARFATRQQLREALAANVAWPSQRWTLGTQCGMETTKAAVADARCNIPYTRVRDNNRLLWCQLEAKGHLHRCDISRIRWLRNARVHLALFHKLLSVRHGLCSSPGRRTRTCWNRDMARRASDSKLILEQFPSNRADKPFYKWMAQRSAGDCFHRFNFKHSQVGLPSLVTKQWIVLSAEVGRATVFCLPQHRGW